MTINPGARAAATVTVLAIALTLTGCTGSGPYGVSSLDDEHDAIETEVEAVVEGVEGVLSSAVYVGTGRLSIDVNFDDCMTAVESAPLIAAAVRESPEAARRLTLALQVGDIEFDWISPTKDREDSFVAATQIWCDTFADADPFTANVSPPQNFLRGEEFGLSLAAPDAAAAEALRSRVSGLASEAGFRVRPNGIKVQVDPDGAPAP